MMKKFFAKVLGFACSMAMVASMVLPASAADNYTYTVRFLSGAQGEFKSGKVSILNADNSLAYSVSVAAGDTIVTIKDLEYGQRVVFNQSLVNLNNGSKYYVKGIRESGKDNNTIDTKQTSFSVSEDIDYVVGYGLLAEAVQYTVEYVDVNGNELLPSETYYGNVGDRPVIAFQFIDGYVPQAYNLTGTLLDDPLQNIFRFVYTALPAGNPGGGTPGGGGGTIVLPGGGGEPDTPGGNPDGPVNPGTPDNPDGGDGNPDDNNPDVNIPDDNTPTDDTPAEIIDIRDDETALSDGSGLSGKLSDDGTIKSEGASAFFTKIPTAAKIGIGGCVVALVGGAVYLLFIRKKFKNDDK